MNERGGPSEGYTPNFTFDQEVEKRYSIAQVAEKLGVVEHTLRKYEKDYDLLIPRNEMSHRYYTEKEIKVFELIIKLKDQGLNIHAIKSLLQRSVDVMEQKKEVAELVTLDKLTGAEFKEMFMQQLVDIIQQKDRDLREEYDQKYQEMHREMAARQAELVEQINDLKESTVKVGDELYERIKVELKQENDRQDEQRKTENAKFMEVIGELRDNKKEGRGLLSRLFGK